MSYQKTQQNDQKTPNNLSSSSQQRWDAVFLGTIILTGSSFCMQELPSTHDYLKIYFSQLGFQDYYFEYFYNLSQSITLGLLVFYAILTGMLSDLYKPGLILIMQTSFLVLSQFLIYLSIYAQNFWLLFAGRIILFAQCSSMFVSIKVFVNNHTSENRKGISLGIMTAGGTSAFGINLLLEPKIVSLYCLDVATFITFLVASQSFILALVCYNIEQNTLKSNDHQYELQNLTNQQLQISEVDKKEYAQNEQEEQLGQIEQLKRLDKLYWLFCGIMFLSNVLSTVIEFIVPALISHHWGYEFTSATSISAIVPFLSLVVPFLGYLTDKLNRDYEWIILSSTFHILGIVLLGFYSPIYGIICFGIGYTMRITIIGPFLTKLVPGNMLGRAYGLIRSLKDLFGMFVFFTISLILKETHSYLNVIWLLLAISFTVQLISILFFFIGKR